jgi:molecular chaperone DnaK
LAIKFLLIKKQTIEDALSKLKAAHQAQDIASIDSSLTELNNAWSAASQDLYNATQQNTGGADAGQDTQNNQNSTGDNVTDAEYEEVK